MERGDKVRCLEGGIDTKRGKGQIGIVEGFARFSSYHGREVFVKFDDGDSGWFWEVCVEKV